MSAAAASGALLAIDIGGTGARAILEHAGGRHEHAGEGAAVEAHGSTVPEVAGGIIRAARQRHPEGFAAVGIGSTGVPSLVADPAGLAASLAREAGAPVALAADAVTAHLGALGGTAGVVVAAGTGVVVLGTDLDRHWTRVDGWGHLLGDRGSGARIGMAGLQAAIGAFDGVDAGGAALLAAARARFGAPETWPAQLYPRPDRAGVLASFVADVEAVADAGDAAAAGILAEAGRELAGSAAAALRPGLAARVALTGGIARIPRVHDAFDARLAELAPRAERVAAAGGPLDGALELARRVAAGTLASHPSLLWIAAPPPPLVE